MKRVVLLMIIVMGASLFSCSKEAIEAPAPERYELSELRTEEALENKTLELVNDFRDSRDLSILITNDEAYKLALEHSRHMANKGVLSHANFTERAQHLAAEVNATLISENLSRNYPSAEETLKGWMGSPKHRATILNGEYTHTAVAVVSTPDGEVYYTQIFFRVNTD